MIKTYKTLTQQRVDQIRALIQSRNIEEYSFIISEVAVFDDFKVAKLEALSKIPINGAYWKENRKRRRLIQVDIGKKDDMMKPVRAALASWYESFDESEQIIAISHNPLALRHIAKPSKALIELAEDLVLVMILEASSENVGKFRAEWQAIVAIHQTKSIEPSALISLTDLPA